MGEIMKYKSKKLIDNIYWVGVIDYKLKVFDIIMETEFGSTYNSYIVKGSEKTALIDTAKANFKEEYFERIKDVVAIEDIDYLVMNHTEPDHSGLIKDILKINPNIKIYASAPALMNLKEILNVPFEATRITNGMELSLGDKTLEFFVQPNLHWPDTIFTNVREDNFLFTCDFFGAHYASEEILVKDCKDQEGYLRALKEYFDAIMHPFLPYVRKGLERVKSLQPKHIAVSHGLVLSGAIIDEFFKLYDKWSVLPEKFDKPLVLIPYASAYGYTEKMAMIIKETIETELKNEVYIKTYDLIFADRKEITKLVPVCDAFLLGSSTIVRDTVKVVWELLAEIDYEMARGKIASAFGSYGWSGEAVDNIIQREQQLMFKTVEGLKIKFNPSEEQIEEIVTYAKQIANKIKK
jgi:flavorubredoxin